MSKIFVITAPEILEKPDRPGMISFRFKVDSGAYLKIKEAELSEAPYGILKAVEDGAKKVDFLWQISLGVGNHPTFSGEFDPFDERDLRDLKMVFEDTLGCVVLMQKDVFSRFEEFCKGFDFELIVHHCEESLSAA